MWTLIDGEPLKKLFGSKFEAAVHSGLAIFM